MAKVLKPVSRKPLPDVFPNAFGQAGLHMYVIYVQCTDVQKAGTTMAGWQKYQSLVRVSFRWMGAFIT